MSIHVSFKNLKQSETVIEHVEDLMADLVKMTDGRCPFHVNLNKKNDETHHVNIICHFRGKSLASEADHENLYKALSKSVQSMKTQVIRRNEKQNAHHSLTPDSAESSTL